MAAWRQHSRAVREAITNFGLEVVTDTQNQPEAAPDVESDAAAPQLQGPAGSSTGRSCSSGSIPLTGPSQQQGPAVADDKLPFHDQDALNLLCCCTGAGWVELDAR